MFYNNHLLPQTPLMALLCFRALKTKENVSPANGARPTCPIGRRKGTDMIASDGRVHLIHCELCPNFDGHSAISASVFLDAMKRLGWQLYRAEEGWDTICPDCHRKRTQSLEAPKIALGR